MPEEEDSPEPKKKWNGELVQDGVIMSECRTRLTEACVRCREVAKGGNDGLTALGWFDGLQWDPRRARSRSARRPRA